MTRARRTARRPSSRPSFSRGPAFSRGLAFSGRLCSGALIVSLAAMFGGLAAGYRPVVIQSGSMGDTAPPGSLIIAAPLPADRVTAGDVLVMRRPGSATVTHRVIEVERSGNERLATTKGDANESIDVTPHALNGAQLVGRWYLPNWGRRLQAATRPEVTMTVVGLVVALLTLRALRRIWLPDPTSEPGDRDTFDRSLPTPPRRRPMAAIGSIVLALVTAGTTWSLLHTGAGTASHEPGGRECSDPVLGSLQKGAAIHAADGPVTLAINPVDATRSFVLATVRNASGEPADSAVLVRLADGGTALELLRSTDAPSPPPITISWSVVEYRCGITVQRGLIDGDDGIRSDVAIDEVPPDRSFVLVSSNAANAAEGLDAGTPVVVDLVSPTAIAVRDGAPLGPGHSFAWQVVTFDDPGLIAVQRLAASVPAGATDVTVALSGPVDPQSTFLLTGIATEGNRPDPGARTARARFSSSNSIEVSRRVPGDALEVSIQVVALGDGSTVRHGTVELSPGQPAATVSFPPIDPSRSTALATTDFPGSATFEVRSATTVVLTREAVTSEASFGWQVIEWTGSPSRT